MQVRSRPPRVWFPLAWSVPDANQKQTAFSPHFLTIKMLLARLALAAVANLTDSHHIRPFALRWHPLSCQEHTIIIYVEPVNSQ